MKGLEVRSFCQERSSMKIIKCCTNYWKMVELAFMMNTRHVCVLKDSICQLTKEHF